MNHEQLLQKLNTTPLNINTKLIELVLSEYQYSIWLASERIKSGLKSEGVTADKDFMETNKLDQFIQKRITIRYGDSRYAKGEISLKELPYEYPDFLIHNYCILKEDRSLIKRITSLLKHEKDGYFQPTFSINKANSIYTSKPAIQIPHEILAYYLDCDYHHFDSLEEAINAISNAKPDSEIITVIKKTVYFRTPKYFEEKERKRQEAIEGINNLGFLPLCSYLSDSELEYLGLSDFLGE